MLGPNGEKSKPSVRTREEYKLQGSMHITVMCFLECYYFPIFHKKIDLAQYKYLSDYEELKDQHLFLMSLSTHDLLGKHWW